MPASNRFILLIATLVLILCSGCSKGFKKLLNDEVYLQDGSTATGTLKLVDSARVQLQKADLSRQVIGWQDIDSIGSVSHRTAMVAAALGVHSTPYYSVFQGEVYQPTGLGLQVRAGTASFGKTYKYVSLSYVSGSPYGVTKMGLGIQRHLWMRYTQLWSPYVGLDANLMFVRNNNAPQLAVEPFMGADLRLTQQFRLIGRLGFQLNPASMANQMGASFAVGASYSLRNFQAHYDYILREHRLPKRFNP